MNSLTPVEYSGQRILTTAQLAEFYETSTKRISANFKRNQKRYVLGTHYFFLEGEELQAFKSSVSNCYAVESNCSPICGLVDGKAPALYLWTERGALLHAKSINTDQAWEVYAYLIETYFRAKDLKLTEQASGFTPKEIGLGEVASLLKILTSIMRDQKSAPHLIAKQARLICQNFNIPVIPEFVKTPAFEQLQQDDFPAVTTEPAVA